MTKGMAPFSFYILPLARPKLFHGHVSGVVAWGMDWDGRAGGGVAH